MRETYSADLQILLIVRNSPGHAQRDRHAFNREGNWCADMKHSWETSQDQLYVISDSTVAANNRLFFQVIRSLLLAMRTDVFASAVRDSYFLGAQCDAQASVSVLRNENGRGS